MKIGDLKVKLNYTVIIKLRNGMFCTLGNRDGDDVLIDFKRGEIERIACYNDNMTHKTIPGLDIVKVLAPINFDALGFEVAWERQDPIKVDAKTLVELTYVYLLGMNYLIRDEQNVASYRESSSDRIWGNDSFEPLIVGKYDFVKDKPIQIIDILNDNLETVPQRG
jgi:hypothetical protein